jgi:hypothetical protein
VILQAAGCCVLPVCSSLCAAGYCLLRVCSWVPSTVRPLATWQPELWNLPVAAGQGSSAYMHHWAFLSVTAHVLQWLVCAEQL